MVAESQSIDASPRKIPLGTVLKVRNLYLIHGLSNVDIASQVGLEVKAVGQLVFRKGWTKIRQKKVAEITQRADARMEREVDEINDAIASECEEIALQGLGRAKQAAESQDEFAARNFQSWSGGVSNLVKVQRACRGLDSNVGKDSEGARTVNLSFFVGSLSQSDRAQGMKCVGPVVECESVPALTQGKTSIETAPGIGIGATNTNTLRA